MNNTCKHGARRDDLCQLCVEEHFLETQLNPDGSEQSEPQDDTVDAVGRIQVGFDVVELQRVSMQPGDVLMVTVKNDGMDQASIQELRHQLSLVFPNNKIFVFGMGTADDVKLSVIGQESIVKLENVGYCSNCNCGKKERAENALEGESDARTNDESCCGNQCGSGCPSS